MSKLQMKQEGAMKRERAIAYALSQQVIVCTFLNIMFEDELEFLI